MHRHRALHFVVKNALENLSDEWSIIIFHGTHNIVFVNKIIIALSQYSHRLSTIQLNVSNLTCSEYSQLLVSNEFYANIPTEIFLIFQTDSIIFSANKDKINKFLKYDYVGAPCRGGPVMNGGLSLRRKSKMLEIISSKPYQGEPEDVYFCNNTYLYRPCVEEANEFSVEYRFNEASFGSHKGYRFHPKLCKWYPELAILRDLQPGVTQKRFNKLF
jgi:hypothetical protein